MNENADRCSHLSESFVAGPLRRKLRTAYQELRQNPKGILRELIGLSSRMIVFSADASAISPPQDRVGVTFRPLSNDDFTCLPDDLRKEQLDRVSTIGENRAYGVFVDGALAHVSWLLAASHEGRTPPRVLLLRSDEAEITGCFTLPAFRGKGLYPFAIQSIARSAKQQGIRLLFMKTKPDNIASQNGILKAGLHRAGTAIHCRWPLLRFDAVLRGHRLNLG